MNAVRKTGLQKLNTLELIERIVDKTDDMKVISVLGDAEKEIKELARRFGITPMQALFLSVFVDQSDDCRIQPRDLARHFDCRTISVLAKEDVIESLVSMRFIARKRDRDGDISYRVPRISLDAIKAGKMPEREKLDGLSAQQWIEVVGDLLGQREQEEITDEDLETCFDELLEKNQHLKMVSTIRNLNLDYSDLLLFLVMSIQYIDNHDDRIQRGDIDDYFYRNQFREHVQQLENGTHILMEKRLVEHSCIDGQIESTSWCLTSYSKTEVYVELNLKTSTNVRANLTHFEDIKEKKMFYTPNVAKQVYELHSLLEPEKMERIVKRLESKGMRKGFTCIFYGGPGTGKTETVMQLARLTKRDIMLVDIPSIRSKWVGEQEKNIKALFDLYRKAAEGAADGKAPILLFNEADALLNKRNENGLGCADKEENSMQNIILQEMENLDGIMIATTNLAGSLDEAFERRFLYKINFEKPTPKERKNIWKAMLPDLSDKDALSLAERFDFSGGQIENITRKRIITDILHENDSLDINSIVESCRNEMLNSKNSIKHIGF